MKLMDEETNRRWMRLWSYIYLIVATCGVAIMGIWQRDLFIVGLSLVILPLGWWVAIRRI